MAAHRSSKLVIYAALTGNLLVAITKFGAAAWTGSSAMLSEAIHSLVDTANQGLMLYGIRLSKRPADEDHPFGHGRELYFWSFIVALLIFSLGAGISFYEGVVHIRHPVEITNPLTNYIVLIISFVFEGGSWWVAWSEFRKQDPRADVLQAVIRSRDPTIFLVLLEDSAALAGLAIALAGTCAAQVFAMPILDGAASIGIGMVLALTSVFLARESKGLLIGEPARPMITRSILDIARSERGIAGVGKLISVHLAPDQIIASLDVVFEPTLSAQRLAQIAAELEQRIISKHKEISSFKVHPVIVS